MGVAFASLVISINYTGLFGFASFMAWQRTKEIGEFEVLMAVFTVGDDFPKTLSY